jgi:8-oxo-dGTP diphosphatase
MSEDRFKLIATVYVIFIKNNKILLYKRVNTNWQDGKYNFPGGHLEENETIFEAAVREAYEESGLKVDPKDLELVHVMHRLPVEGVSLETNRNIIDIFFKATKWSGEPKITEENKSDDMIWADLNDLPEDMVMFEKAALDEIKKGSKISVFSK